MTETHVGRCSLEQMFGGGPSTTYDVPLYQREYAWGETEIHQLFDDLWEAYLRNSQRNYHLGTLVVYSRNENVFELIDGQQRLTTLSLIYKLLKPSCQTCRVTFSNRDSSIEFLRDFFSSENPWCYLPTIAAPQSFREALSAIRDYRYTSGDDSCARGGALSDLLGSESDADSFRNFILHKLQLFVVTMPPATDVSSYFEVMNNRGKQLEPHEIIKEQLVARLYEQSKDLDDEALDQLANRFDSFWSACSNMNGHLISHMDGCLELEGDQNASWKEEWVSCKVSDSDRGDYDQFRSVIDDFPNFLLHVLRLYVKKTGGNPDDVPLDDRQLSNAFQGQMQRIDPIGFLDVLIRTRLKFDRYVVKARYGEDGAVTAWTLRHVVKQGGKRELIDTFGESDVGKRKAGYFRAARTRLIRVQSMLQVTYRGRRYKDWLYRLLETEEVDYSDPANVVSFLENYTRVRLSDAIKASGQSWFCRGCATPHVVFNVLDYLLWRKAFLADTFDTGGSMGPGVVVREMEGADERFVDDDFVFAYRSSVEHHHPQHQFSDDGVSGVWDNKEDVDDIGNLCIVYPNENSSLNNRSPKDKADHQRQSGRVAPPKQRWMYKKTIRDGAWNVSEMQRQSKMVRDLVENFCRAPMRAHRIVERVVADADCEIALSTAKFVKFDSRACNEQGGCEIVIRGRAPLRHGLRIWFGFEENDWRACFVGVYSTGETEWSQIEQRAKELCSAYDLRNSCAPWPTWISLVGNDAHWDDAYLACVADEKSLEECVGRISGELRKIVQYAQSLESALDATVQ